MNTIADISHAYHSGRITQAEALHELRRLRPDWSETTAVYVLDDPRLAVTR